METDRGSSRGLKYGIAMLVLSLILMPASLIVKRQTDIGEISPFFYWQLYYAPYSPESSHTALFVSLASGTPAVVELRDGAGYNKTALESLMRSIVREDDTDAAMCLAAALGLGYGGYSLVSIPGADLQDLDSSTVGAADRVSFALVEGADHC